MSRAENKPFFCIEDNPIKQIHVPKEGFKKAHHYSWEDTKKDFGKDEWIFSRRNAGILAGTTPALCYKELAQKTQFPSGRYFEKLREAMLVWAGLFLLQS